VYNEVGLALPLEQQQEQILKEPLEQPLEETLEEPEIEENGPGE
jgi:hypothetical protein